MANGSGKSYFCRLLVILSHLNLPLILTPILFITSTNFVVAQPASTAYQTVIKGDDSYKQRADLSKCREAIVLYEQAFSAYPNEEIAVRLAKACYWLGSHSPEKDRIEIFQKGIDWSKTAIEINPKQAGGYFWLGVNDAKYGEARGILKSLFLVGPIKDAMHQVISIDPGYEYGGAYRVLGRMYFKLPRFVGGGMDKAFSNLKKSLEYAPNITTTHLFLAEVYMAQNDYMLAQQELNVILNTSPIPGLEPEMQQDKASARLLMVEVNNKIKD
jgi:tetratricopeptide (TPR) repeat protein